MIHSQNFSKINDIKIPYKIKELAESKRISNLLIKS
jgi:hypothetical protein